MTGDAVDIEALARRIDAIAAQVAPLADDRAPGILPELEALKAELGRVAAFDESLRLQNDELHEAQLALELERERLDELFNDSPDAYLVTDGTGVILDANARAEVMLDVAPPHLLGKPLAAFTLLPDRKRLRSAFRAAPDYGEGVVVRLRRRNGVLFHGELRAAASATGDRRELRWTLRDVTERVQAEQALWELSADLEARVAARTAEVEAERERLAAVLEAMPAAVILYDADQGATALNQLGQTLLTSIEREQPTYHAADGRELAPDELPGARAVATRKPVLGERITARDGRGRARTHDVDAVPLLHDRTGRRSALVVTTDVTDVERRERADRDFVSNAAHQLRTPLAAIASVVAALQGGAKDIPEERERFLGHLQRETDRLARLGRAMLTLARAQRGEEEAQRAVVPLRPVLDAIVADVPAKDGVDVEIECASDVGAIANDELLTEALSNLVGNAVSYTDSGTVSIRARIVDGTTTVEVADTGRGIARDDQPRVFERFYRSADAARGFGLGLAIARSAIEAAGGAIELDSEEGVGTTVRLQLPSARVVA